MTPDEVNDPEQDRGDKVDPVIKAQVALGLENAMRSMMIYAQRLSEEPLWPIGLCVAWVLRQDASEVVGLYARHRLGIGVIAVDGWVDARRSLLRGLAAGKIGATGFSHEGGGRASIPAVEWIDLRIQQRGQFDEVRRADSPIAYLDVRIAAAAMKMEWPAATPATNRAHDKQEGESAFLHAAKERMLATPNNPIAKQKLLLELPKVSERAFDRLYSQAARETGCVAWSKAGRRRRKTT